MVLSLRVQAPALKDILKADIKIAGIANSKHMIVNPDGLNLSKWKDDLALVCNSCAYTRTSMLTCVSVSRAHVQGVPGVRALICVQRVWYSTAGPGIYCLIWQYGF